MKVSDTARILLRTTPPSSTTQQLNSSTAEQLNS
jgi:hypothetical protein